nr:DUF2381 family protein [Pyxidicoccus xibeiensis]
MKNLQGRHIALLLALVTAASLAGARDRDKAAVRTLLLSEHPRRAAHSVYVMGQVVTVLRFEHPCDPARTRLLGWEGRFEPLVVTGRKVILEPLRDLDSDERVSLVVTLADGTEVPFLLAPPHEEEWGWTDQQVNVFKDQSSYDSVLSALYDTLKEKQALKAENERLRSEETSVDHAFASLLVKGAEKQTPFKVKQTWSVKEADAEITVATYSGKGKAAVLFTLKNHDPRQPWKLGSRPYRAGV